jgi:aminopeptidase
MQDPRYDQLAEVLTGYSTRLQNGEKVLIDTFDVPVELVVALIRKAREKGAIPLVNLQSNVVNRELLRGAEENQYQLIAEYEMVRMKGVAAYIAVRGSNNITEQSDVPPDRMKLAMKLLKPVLDQRVNKTKWVVLRWPTSSMAQMAGMSTEAF